MAFPEIIKIGNDQQRIATIKAAENDNHNFPFPTHTVIKDGQISGALSVAAVPLVLLWSNTETMKTRDSLIVDIALKTIISDRGIKFFYAACDVDSPYFQLLDKVGYRDPWATSLFLGQPNTRIK